MAADQHAPTETVVEFGAPEPEAHQRRRWSATEIFVGLGADRRTVPMAAAVGAVALFASLISEWQVTVLETTDRDNALGGNRPVPAGVADLGALGAGYLVGLFVLAGAVVFVLFGPPAGRSWARLAGLTVAGVEVALLGGLAHELDSATRTPLGIFAASIPSEQVHLTYGRGIWCALAGVAAVALALWLAGRHLHPVAHEATAEPPPEETWSWRRPRTAPDDEGAPDAPIGLTVTSVTPFTSRSGDRDAPA